MREMTDRQMKDREISTTIWYMLRDFGDITTNESDSPRWEAVVDIADETGRKYPEARRLIAVVLGMLEDRAKGK